MATIYQEYTKKSGDPSSVWRYFLRNSFGSSALCKKCSSIIKTGGGSTKGLHTHMKTKHNLNTRTASQLSLVKSSYPDVLGPSTSSLFSDLGEEPPKKKNVSGDVFSSFLLTENFVDCAAMVSRMVAKDGIPFKTFCSSADLRDLFEMSGFHLPSSPRDIKNVVLKYSQQLKNEIISDLFNLKEEGFRFSLTFDEWNSSCNRRFININVHINKNSKNLFRNIGLVRVYESMTEAMYITSIKNKLDEFNIDIKKDVVSFTTNDVQIMQKLSKLLDFDSAQQLCLAQAVRLGILDVMYNKKDHASCEQPSTVKEEQFQNDSFDDSNEDFEEEDIDSAAMFFVTYDQEELDSEVELLPQYQDLIDKIRKTVRLFKKSSGDNYEFLQKYIIEDFGKEIWLINDNRARWNSLVNMIDKFDKVKLCVCKALIDMQSDITFNEQELDLIRKINAALQPLKLTVEVLCRKDSTLLTAESTLQFMISKLESQSEENELSRQLACSLKRKIKERRTVLSGILIYLQNPSQYSEEREKKDECFTIPNTDVIRKEIKMLIERLQSEDSEQPDTRKITEEAQSLLLLASQVKDFTPATSTTSTSSEDIKLEDELEMHLEKFSQDASTVSPAFQTIDDILKREMALFESGGIRGKYLSLAHKYLLSVPPTSAECVRAVFTTGYLTNKFPNALSNKELDTLCFLRSNFKYNQN